MSQLTVVYVVSTLGHTGPTSQLLNIVKYLDKERTLPRIITLSREPTKTLKPEFDVLNVPIYSLGLGRIEGHLHGHTSLQKLLAIIKPDIIHSQGIRADLLSARLANYSYRFATQRNIPEHDYPLLYGKFLGSIFAYIHRQALARIPYLVACSTSIADNNKMNGIDSIVVKNSVDLDLCTNLPTQEQRLVTRDSLNQDRDGCVFIYTGPMIRRKNPDVLIKSFLEWTKHSRHQLWLLGDGNLIKECRRLARGHPNIMVLGHVSDISPYLQSADVFVSASTSEGFPNSVLEALLCGLSLILSDIPPHRELVEKHPKIGRLFPLGDTTELSKGFEYIKIDCTTRHAAHDLATSEYSAKLMAQRYMALYEMTCPKV